MQEIKLTIKGCPRTKKNNMRIVRFGSRYSIRASKQYEAYEKQALAQIPDELKQLRIDYPVTLTCVYYMETHRRVDLCNLLEATCDILAKGVLLDDNCTIVVSHDGSRVEYDKENPRVEVTISAKS